MQKNTTKVTVSVEGCSPVEEVHYLELSVPDRESLLNPLSPNRSVQYETTLSSGMLSRIENSLVLRIYRVSNYTSPSVALFIKFSSDVNSETVMLKSAPTAKFSDNAGAILNGFALTFYSSTPQYTLRMGAGYLEYEYLSNSWPNQECVLTFAIPITYMKLPRFVDEPQVMLKDEDSLGKLDTSSLFNSKVFSDVVVECGSTVYPAHQVVLSGNSRVFQAMLTLPTEEARKSQIIIKDVDPHVFEALLRFIYTGKVDPAVLEERGDDLYRAADKYEVKDLLLYCEAHLLENVKPENALVMYDLAQCRPNSALAKKCSEIIARNRDNIAADVDSFKNFTNKYPDLIFEIFRK